MKSYVTIETKQCLVCCKLYETGTVLMDTRMKDRFEDRSTCTGLGLCPEHQEKFDAGYVAFVGCDIAKSEFLPNGNIKPEKAYRTGNVAFLKRHIIPELFKVPIPDDISGVFCNDDLITQFLQNIPIEGEENEENES